MMPSSQVVAFPPTSSPPPTPATIRSQTTEMRIRVDEMDTLKRKVKEMTVELDEAHFQVRVRSSLVIGDWG